MAAHLDVPLKLFDETVFLLHLELHGPILLLQLLHKERLHEVGSLFDTSAAILLTKIGLLLLQLNGQVLDLFLLPVQVDVKSLSSGPQPGILVLNDVELDLQVAVEILDLLDFLRGVNWCPAGFRDLLCRIVNVVHTFILRSGSSPALSRTLG